MSGNLSYPLIPKLADEDHHKFLPSIEPLLSHYLVDGLGSTRGLTDENGNVTDVYYYDAYGNLTDSVGSSENSYLFAGEQFDESLDQYYLRQRYYDPSGFIASTAESTAALQMGAILASLAHLITLAADPPERLKGFGEGVPPMTSNDLYPHPRNPKDILLEKLLRLRGFGEGQQPNLPTHTGHSRDYTLYDLIRHIFPTEEFVPNGKLSRVTDKWLKSNSIDAHDVKEYLPGPAKYSKSIWVVNKQISSGKGFSLRGIHDSISFAIF